MISRRLLWTIAIGVAGVLIATWYVGSLPATVVIINQTGTTLRDVVIDADGNRYEIGMLGNSETRRITVRPAAHLRLTFHGEADRVWNSAAGVSAGQSLILYITPGDHVAPRNSIGTFTR